MSLKRVHLQYQADATLELHYSHFQQSRALQLHQFLKALMQSSNQELGLRLRLELLVLSAKDWSRLSPSVYGLSTFRARTSQVQLLAPADYPSKLRHQLDDSFLAKAFKTPGDIAELFDLMLGIDWARAYLRALGRSKKTAHETLQLALELYLLALDKGNWDGPLERLRLWFAYPFDKQAYVLSSSQARSLKTIVERYLAYGSSFKTLEPTKLSWNILKQELLSGYSISNA